MFIIENNILFLQFSEKVQIQLGNIITACDSVSSLIVCHEHKWLGLLDVGVVADDPRHAHLPDPVKLVQSEPSIGVLSMLEVEPVSLLQSDELVPDDAGEGRTEQSVLKFFLQR